jgi:splicing factor 3B subunit 1
MISPIRNDAFALGDKTPDVSVRTYADIMREQQLARERDNTLKNIADKKRKEEEEMALDAVPTKASGIQLPPPPAAVPAAKPPGAGDKRRNRWDQSISGDA